MRRNILNKVVSLVLSILLVATIMPIDVARAEDTDEDSTIGEETTTEDENTETEGDNTTTVTVNVTEGGKVIYNGKEIDYLSSEKTIPIQENASFKIVPSDGYYVSGIKRSDKDITFEDGNLSRDDLSYTYTASQDIETPTLDVIFNAFSTITPKEGNMADYTTITADDVDHKYYISADMELKKADTKISDGKTAFADSITISANQETTIETIYELNSSPSDFSNVVIAKSINATFIGDKTKPIISINNENDAVWVNNAEKENVTISGTVTEAYLKEFKWGKGAGCTPDELVDVNVNGAFSITGIDISSGDNVIKMSATDRAGNVGDKMITVKCDETAPTIETEFEYADNNNVFLKWFNNVFKYWITKKDTPCSLIVQITDTEAGVDEKSVSVKVGQTVLDLSQAQKESIANGFKYTFTNVEIPTTETAICVTAKDKVGNVYDTASSQKIVQDDENPTLYLENMPIKDSDHNGIVTKDYYFKHTSEDAQDSLSLNVKATDNVGLKSYRISGTGIAENRVDDYLPSDVTSEDDYIKSTGDTAKIVTAEDINRDTYDVTFEAEDLAGNRTTGTIHLINDTTAPTVTLKNMDGVVDIEGEACYFTKMNKISATVTASDQGVGLKTIELIDGQKTIQKKNVTGASADVTFGDIAINGTHKLTVRTTDELGNTETTNLLPGHDSTIKYDAKTPSVSFVTRDAVQDANGNALFADKTVVKANISDVDTGIASVAYSIEKPAYDSSASVSGQGLYNIVNKGTNRGIKMTTPTKKSLSKDIHVDGNSNDIQLKVDVTDGAGNFITVNNIKKVSIDKTAPTISVSYDNNNADSGNRFCADRTATITVVERNFNANDFKLSITNSAGEIPSISGWTTLEDATNPDNNKHVATVHFTADGDYTMDMSYVDMAGNHANKVETQTFTIDKSAPAVGVSFDNNNATQEKYFASERTATITVNEHYFDPSRVIVTGTATNDGAAIAFPAVSGWTDQGDTHTATIHFGADGDYQFTVAATDQAGNASLDYAVGEFTIDKTIPTITFGGVEDQAAYNDVVEPMVTFEDVNYDANNIQITLTGANNGTVDYGNGASDGHNGQTISYSDFAHDPEMDDIYTLTATVTDMAGNTFEDSISFSVNRYGSNYVFDDTLTKTKGTYMKEPIDVIFTETNVNTLAEGTSKVVVSVNGNPTTLELGTDYTVETAGGGGSWSQYTYNIPKKVFQSDATYIVSVYSEDTAGNINENDADGKDAEITFGVDSTSPEIVIANLQKNAEYNTTNYEAVVSVQDNLVLQDVNIQLNGTKVDATVENDRYSFNIPETTKKQVVTVSASDAAGNTMTEEVQGIVVSTNPLVRFFSNTKLVVGTVGSVTAVGGGLGFFVFRKRLKLPKIKTK